MGLPPMVLKPANTLLSEFACCSMQSFKGIELFIMTGNHPTQTTIKINFLIVDAPSVYNVIIRRPTLNAL